MRGETSSKLREQVQLPLFNFFLPLGDKVTTGLRVGGGSVTKHEVTNVSSWNKEFNLDSSTVLRYPVYTLDLIVLLHFQNHHPSVIVNRQSCTFIKWLYKEDRQTYTNKRLASSHLSPSAGTYMQPHCVPTALQQRHPVGKKGNIDALNTVWVRVTKLRKINK